MPVLPPGETTLLPRGYRPDHEAIQRGELPTPMEAQRRILVVGAELAEAVLTSWALNEDAASARVDWEQHRDRTRVFMSTESSTQGEKDAHAKSIPNEAGVLGEELYRNWRILEARSESSSKYVESLRSQLSAYQTLTRGLQQQAGETP